MKKQVDYRVIVGINGPSSSLVLDDFFHYAPHHGEGGFYSLIKEYMNDGWVCQGRFKVGGNGQYYQTMVKYED